MRYDSINLWYSLAAVLSLATFAIHTFVGGRYIAAPLLKAQLKTVPKITTYYCWHIVTIMLFLMGAGYGVAAFTGVAWSAAVLSTALAAGCAGLSILLTVTKKLKVVVLPQWTFFLPITLFGILGSI